MKKAISFFVSAMVLAPLAALALSMPIIAVPRDPGAPTAPHSPRTPMMPTGPHSPRAPFTGSTSATE